MGVPVGAEVSGEGPGPPCTRGLRSLAFGGVSRTWGGASEAEGGPQGRKGLGTPTETDVQRDALCFMVKTWAGHKTTEMVLNDGWWLAAVGGGWRLAFGGPLGLSLTKKQRVLKDGPAGP